MNAEQHIAFADACSKFESITEVKEGFGTAF
jgi:hypothetical protein